MAEHRKASAPFSRLQQLPFLYLLMTALLVTATLYWAQEVIVPVALAIFLAFLLTPLVNFLQHHRFRRLPAIIVVVAFAFMILGAMGWAVFKQTTTLINELPHYQDNIKHKIADLRGAGKGSFLEKMQKASQQVIEELKQADPTEEQASPAPSKPTAEPRAKQTPTADSKPKEPIPVAVQGPSIWWQIPVVFEQLATAGLVVLLVFFILLDQGDLRNRIIRLIGLHYLPTTTKALDDASHRVSRYLLMQTIINGTFGVAVGLVLFFLGLPHAFLWGLLATVLRFIPYVGVIVAIVLPTILSLAVFPGWTKPLLVFGILSTLEGINNMILETYLYGQSIGVSSVALIIAFAFWTWLWGPIGLLLATPLTVAIVVLGKYVPQLAFFDILMGDEPVMEPHTQLYQRLVAQDQDEATAIIDTYLKTHTQDETAENVLLPALHRAKEDYARRIIDDGDRRFVIDATQAILDDFQATPGESAALLERPPSDDQSTVISTVKILTLPVHDEIDEVALHMLVPMLDSREFTFDQLPSTFLASEVVTVIADKQVGLLCLGTVAPGGLAKARYLCKRLRANLPNIKIVVGHWGFVGDTSKSQELLKAAGADYVGSTLQETCKQLQEASRLFMPTEIAPHTDLPSLSSAGAEAH